MGDNRSSSKSLAFSVENILSSNFKRKSESTDHIHPLKSLKEDFSDSGKLANFVKGLKNTFKYET